MMYPSQPPQEQPLYTDGQVTVTTARFIAGSMMYPVRGITAVQPILIPANRGPGYLTTAIGFSLLMVGVVGSNSVFNFWGAVVLLAGIAWAVAMKPVYVVRIWTAGGQADAVSSKDQARMQQIVAALHRATMGG